jgi:hypothetical protein
VELILIIGLVPNFADKIFGTRTTLMATVVDADAGATS